MDELAVEVLLRVGRYLCGTDVARCARVSRAWRAAFRDAGLWRAKV